MQAVEVIARFDIIYTVPNGYDTWRFSIVYNIEKNPVTIIHKRTFA